MGGRWVRGAVLRRFPGISLVAALAVAVLAASQSRVMEPIAAEDDVDPRVSRVVDALTPLGPALEQTAGLPHNLPNVPLTDVDPFGPEVLDLANRLADLFGDVTDAAAPPRTRGDLIEALEALDDEAAGLSVGCGDQASSATPQCAVRGEEAGDDLVITVPVAVARHVILPLRAPVNEPAAPGLPATGGAIGGTLPVDARLDTTLVFRSALQPALRPTVALSPLPVLSASVTAGGANGFSASVSGARFGVEDVRLSLQGIRLNATGSITIFDRVADPGETVPRLTLDELEGADNTAALGRIEWAGSVAGSIAADSERVAATNPDLTIDVADPNLSDGYATPRVTTPGSLLARFDDVGPSQLLAGLRDTAATVAATESAGGVPLPLLGGRLADVLRAGGPLNRFLDSQALVCTSGAGPVPLPTGATLAPGTKIDCQARVSEDPTGPVTWTATGATPLPGASPASTVGTNPTRSFSFVVEPRGVPGIRVDYVVNQTSRQSTFPAQSLNAVRTGLAAAGVNGAVVFDESTGALTLDLGATTDATVWRTALSSGALAETAGLAELGSLPPQHPCDAAHGHECGGPHVCNPETEHGCDNVDVNVGSLTLAARLGLRFDDGASAENRYFVQASDSGSLLRLQDVTAHVNDRPVEAQIGFVGLTGSADLHLGRVDSNRDAVVVEFAAPAPAIATNVGGAPGTIPRAVPLAAIADTPQVLSTAVNLGFTDTGVDLTASHGLGGGRLSAAWNGTGTPSVSLDSNFSQQLLPFAQVDPANPDALLSTVLDGIQQTARLLEDADAFNQTVPLFDVTPAELLGQLTELGTALDRVRGIASADGRAGAPPQDLAALLAALGARGVADGAVGVRAEGLGADRRLILTLSRSTTNTLNAPVSVLPEDQQLPLPLVELGDGFLQVGADASLTLELVLPLGPPQDGAAPLLLGPQSAVRVGLQAEGSFDNVRIGLGGFGVTAAGEARIDDGLELRCGTGANPCPAAEPDDWIGGLTATETPRLTGDRRCGLPGSEVLAACLRLEVAELFPNNVLGARATTLFPLAASFDPIPDFSAIGSKGFPNFLDPEVLVSSLPEILESVQGALDAGGALPLLGETLDGGANAVGQLRDEVVVPILDQIDDYYYRATSVGEIEPCLQRMLFDAGLRSTAPAETCPAMSPPGDTATNAAPAGEEDPVPVAEALPGGGFDVDVVTLCAGTPCHPAEDLSVPSDVAVRLVGSREFIKTIGTGDEAMSILPGLPFRLKAGVQVRATIAVDATLGLREDGPYLRLGSDDSDGLALTADVELVEQAACPSAQFPDGTLSIDYANSRCLEADFGFLGAQLTDRNGPDPGTGTTGVHAEAPILKSTNSDIDVGDLTTALFDPSTDLVFAATLDLRFRVGVGAGLPSLVGRLYGAFGADPNLWTLGIDNLHADVGAAKEVLKPVLETVRKAIAPLEPVIAILTTPIPIASDLAELVGLDPVTVLSAAPDGSVDLIESVLDVIGALRQFDESDGFEPLDGVFGLNPQRARQATTPDRAGEMLLNAPAVEAAEASITAAEVDPCGDEFLGICGLSVPILFDSGTAIRLAVGQDVELVNYEPPGLAATIDIPIDLPPVPLVPPVNLQPDLSVEFTLRGRLEVGLETSGIRAAAASGEPIGVLSGLFFGDRDANNDDPNELELEARIRADVGLSVVLIEAGISGSLALRLGINLNDRPTVDGRLTFSEASAFLEEEPLCLFEFNGTLNLSLGFFVEIFYLFDSSRFDVELLDEDVFAFETSCDITLPPEIATQAGDVVTLHLAGGLPNEYVVRPTGPAVDGRQPVAVTAFGQTKEFPEASDQGLSPAAPNRISASGGALDDTIRVDAGRSATGEVIPLAIPVHFTGGAGADTLIGGDGADALSGDGGPDRLVGNAGADCLDGGADDDQLEGGIGDDGTPGNDGTGACTVSGPSGLLGGGGNDEIMGGSGADLAFAGDGDDTLEGGPGDGDGDDVLVGQGGNDTLFGAIGSDRLFGDERSPETDVACSAPGQASGDDALFGGPGDDRIVGGFGNDNVFGDEGSDTLCGNGGIDVLQGDRMPDPTPGAPPPVAGNDTLSGGPGSDALVGWLGDDNLSGDELLQAGSGPPDCRSNGSGLDPDLLYGGPGADVLTGGGGGDEAFGGAGSDTLCGNGGADLLDGDGRSTPRPGDLFGSSGPDFDLLLGSLAPGDDVVDGGDDADRVRGGPGADDLVGGDAGDAGYGGDHNDVILGDRANLVSDPNGTVRTRGAGTFAAQIATRSAATVANDLTARLLPDTRPGQPTVNRDGSVIISLPSARPPSRGGLQLCRDGGGLGGGTGSSRPCPTPTPPPDPSVPPPPVPTRCVVSDDCLLGESGIDVVLGGIGPDDLDGGSENDELRGGDHDDYIRGGQGDDRMLGDAGHDRMAGDAGTDGIFGGSGTHQRPVRALDPLPDGDRLDGGPGPDSLFGDQGVLPAAEQPDEPGDGDFLDGGDDIDALYGEGGNDSMAGGLGADDLWGGFGNDRVAGGDDDDTVSGGGGADSAHGEAGIDRLWGGNRDFRTASSESDLEDGLQDELFGGDKADLLFGPELDKSLQDGGDGADTLTCGGDSCVLRGGFDVDTLIGGPADDLLDGGGGGDDIDGRDSFDTLTYESRSRAVTVTVGVDTADDGELNERDYVRSTVERVVGGSGNDTMRSTDIGPNANGTPPPGRTFEGRAGTDTLVGGALRDVLKGGAGNDSITGNDAADELLGEAGDDNLNGGFTNLGIAANASDGDVDTVNGGANDDRCRPSAEDVFISCEDMSTPIDDRFRFIRDRVPPPIKPIIDTQLTRIKKVIEDVIKKIGGPVPRVPPAVPRVCSRIPRLPCP